MKNEEILKILNVSKNFLGVQALNNVSLTLLKGEVHALVGENGAGKSTLCKIIYGSYNYSVGEIYYENHLLQKGNTIKSQESGIFMIPQELGLIPRLSVMQNIFLGREKNKAGIIDIKYLKKNVREVLDNIGIKLDIDMPIEKLSIDQQQLVTIARALISKAKIIILDEPTSTLAESEVEILFKIIARLKNKGTTIIYITHRLEEIFEVSDRVTILKDGVLVNTCNTSEISKEELINKMVGRTLSQTFPEKRKEFNEDVIIRLENVTVDKNIFNINLDIMKGEILGIGGLVGMGQTTILKAIFGSIAISSGYIEFQGERIHKNSPSKSIKNGINYISSDRRGEMLFLNRSVKENISISSLRGFQNASFLNSKKENYIVDSKISEFNIVVFNREQEVQFLSGGNQQKVILARWLINEPKVLLLDEPTQGIDVGTKEEIYKSLRNLANRGISIIVVFRDMIELLGMCDRIAVIYEGRLIKIFNGIEATEEKIMAAASDNYRE